MNYLDLKAQLIQLLESHQIPYIYNIRKESNALQKFVNENYTAEYVLELIQKLIYIKKHKYYSEDPFWIGCCVNLSDAYSYKEKIETVYLKIAPKKVTQAFVSKAKTEEEKLKEFLDYVKEKFPKQRVEKFLEVKFEFHAGKLYHNCKDEFNKKVIETYFRKIHSQDVKQKVQITN